MKNAIHNGTTIPVTAPSGGLTAGAPYLLGTLLVVPLNTVAETEQTTAYTEGVYVQAKTTGEAWTQGAALYWDVSEAKWTTTASGNTLKGVAYAAAASGDTSGTVLIIQ